MSLFGRMEEAPTGANTQREWAEMEERYHGWAICGLLAFAASVLSFYLMYQHLRNYYRPNHQRHIVRILLMVPIYGVTAWLTFRFVDMAVELEFLRSIYEAVVIYEFFGLILQYLGETTTEQRRNLANKQPQQLLFPLCHMEIDPANPNFLMDFKLGVLQYVVVRPLTTVFMLGMESAGRFHQQSTSLADGYFWFVILNFISTSVAMYVLIVFYLVVRKDIAEYQPITKFLSVKFVIFMTFWQSLFINALDSLGWIPVPQYWSAANVAIRLQNALICLEMFIVSIWHLQENCFGYQEFQRHLLAGAHASSATINSDFHRNTTDTIVSMVYRGGGRSAAAAASLRKGSGHTSVWASLVDIFNPTETIIDILVGIKHILQRLYHYIFARNHEPVVDNRRGDDVGMVDLELRGSSSPEDREIQDITPLSPHMAA